MWNNLTMKILKRHKLNILGFIKIIKKDKTSVEK